MYSFKIYNTVKRNTQLGEYYRKTLDCNCKGIVTKVFKDKSCCKRDKDKIIRSAIVNKETINSGYCMDYNQYLKKRCKTYDQLNVPKPSCDNGCGENNVYKRSNEKFGANEAVTSGLQTEYIKQNIIYFGKKPV